MWLAFLFTGHRTRCSEGHFSRMFLTYDIIRSIAGFPKVNVRVDPQIVSRSNPFSKPTMKSQLLKHSLLLLAAATAVSSSGQGGWKNGTEATGQVDPNVTMDCGYWANNVQNGDTCEMIEDSFGITQSQFGYWVIPCPFLHSTFCSMLIDIRLEPRVENTL